MAQSWSIFANPPANPAITTILNYELDSPGHAAAARRVINAGADHFYYIFDWSALEASTGVFTDVLVDRVVAQSGTLPLWLQIAVVNTDGARHVPSELTATAWDNAAMTSAFNAFLDHLATRLNGRVLEQLFIGNEADTYFNTDATQISPFATFFAAARTHARAVFGTGIKVGTTFTQAACSHFADYAAILSAEDVAPFTYYFLSGNSFGTDLTAIATAIGSTPFVFQEIGFTSDVATWGSSQTTQNLLVSGAFTVLAGVATCLGGTWTQTSDYSNAVLINAGYTSPNLDFFTTVGLRDVNNAPKLGWVTIVGLMGGYTGVDVSTRLAGHLVDLRVAQPGVDLTTLVAQELATVRRSALTDVNTAFEAFA